MVNEHPAASDECLMVIIVTQVLGIGESVLRTSCRVATDAIVRSSDAIQRRIKDTAHAKCQLEDQLAKVNSFCISRPPDFFLE